MKNIVVTLLTVLAFSLPGNLFGAGKKAWPKIVDIAVRAEVTPNNVGCQYSYSVRNSTKNMPALSGFSVDIRTEPTQHPYSRNDLTLSHTLMEHISILDQATYYELVDIQIPAGWQGNGGDWQVIELGLGNRIEPGKIKTGFSFVTKGCAIGIREFIAESYSWDFVENREQYQYPGRELSRVGDPDELMTEVDKGITFSGKTLAPVLPPEPFTPSAWATRITEYAVEAHKLKWIKADKNLAEIKRLISALNTEDSVELKVAVKRIETYVVAEKKKGNLTDEAVALVKLNAEYLLR